MPGAAIAYAIMQAAELAMLLATAAWLHCVVQAPRVRTWCGWSRESTRYWGAYLKIALPSTAAICLDWWTYEAVILIAGLLPDAKVHIYIPARPCSAACSAA